MDTAERNRALRQLAVGYTDALKSLLGESVTAVVLFVELALKAALRAAGVEVPQIHDVGIILKDHPEKFPEAFRKKIERLASISRRLRREREVRMRPGSQLRKQAQCSIAAVSYFKVWAGREDEGAVMDSPGLPHAP